MLVVSAQCGCCHHSVFHFMPYLFGTFWLYYYMVIFLHYNNITWICLIFFCITWCMCCQDYGYCYWWGGLILLFMYHHLFMCSLWSLCYIFLYFFLFCVLCTHFFIHQYPCVFFFQFVCYFSCLDENFWGVWVHMYYMQPHTCVLK